MTFQSDIASKVQQLQVGNRINLYEIDLTDIGGGGILYVTEAIDNDYTPISFNSREYTPIPMKSTGWKKTTDGQYPRPKIAVSNILLSIASYVNTYEELEGAKVTRRRTLEEFLDGKPTANPNAEFPKDIYYIRTLLSKTKLELVFELTPYCDFEGRKLPGRRILRDFCSRSYRYWDEDNNRFVTEDISCPYVGDNASIYFTNFDEYTTDRTQDACSKTTHGCSLRFCAYKANRLGKTIHIQATEPASPGFLDAWLDTSSTPYSWYVYSRLAGVGGNGWLSFKPDPLPTWAFPSVAKYRSPYYGY